MDTEKAKLIVKTWGARLLAAVFVGGIVILAGALGIHKDRLDLSWVDGAAATAAMLVAGPLVRWLDKLWNRSPQGM